MTATTTDADMLKRAVLANPADDAPRLAFADWLDEHGQPERAEFVRLSVALEDINCGCSKSGPPNPSPACIHHPKNLGRARSRCRELFDAHADQWFPVPTGYGLDWGIYYSEVAEVPVDDSRPWFIVRRGFVAEVRCTLAAWVGGECPRCEGGGGYRFAGVHDAVDDACPACHGSGRTLGIGGPLVKAHPLTAVTLTDREPFRVSDEMFYWHLPNMGDPILDGVDERFMAAALPADLYGLVDAEDLGLSYMQFKSFPTRDLATTALGRAALRLAAGNR